MNYFCLHTFDIEKNQNKIKDFNTVPTIICKVAVVIPKGNDDMSRLNNNATVLSVSMPKDNGLYSTSGPGRDTWRNYIANIVTIEASITVALPKLNILSNVLYYQEYIKE